MARSKSLENATIEELRAALERKEALSARPEPTATPDWPKFKKAVIVMIDEAVKNGRADDDIDHWMFEAAINAVYGENKDAFYSWYSETIGS